jgi:hypothetical protein
MSEWWEMSEAEIAADADARLNRQFAYQSALFDSQVGRTVLYDVRNMCYRLGDTSEQTVALLALFWEICARAGANTPECGMAALKAQAEAIDNGQIGTEAEVEERDKLSVE